MAYFRLLLVDLDSEVLHHAILELPYFLEHQQRPEYAHRHFRRTDVEVERFVCCFRLPESLRLPFVGYYV